MYVWGSPPDLAGTVMVGVIGPPSGSPLQLQSQCPSSCYVHVEDLPATETVAGMPKAFEFDGSKA